MAGLRRRHPASYKAKVALEAAMQTRTIAELAKAYRVHPVPISQWKKQLLTLRTDRPAQHGSRVVEEKRCPLRLTPRGRSSHSMMLT
jgi:transposase